MRYLIHKVICFGWIACCTMQYISGADLTSIGYDKLNQVVDVIVSEDRVENHLRAGSTVVRVESANLKNISAGEVSIESCLAALHKKDESLSHDIAMRLLVKYTTMVDSYEKARLRIFLENIAQNLVDDAKQNFQRDYILLWQAYVFFIEIVEPNVNEPFLDYSQKAFKLAESHEDQTRVRFVIKKFLNRLVSTFGGCAAHQIIDLELKHSFDPRFLQHVLADFLKTKPKLISPPPYNEAVRTLPPIYPFPE